MCSNNTSSGSYGELQLHDDEHSGSCRKKQKKNNKVRRRGPGVAALEKILLLEEHKSPLSSPSLPNIHHHTLFAPSNDLVMIPPNFALPENLPNFPVSHGSLTPPQPVFQRKHHSLRMNLPNPSPGAGRFYQFFLEPPSNQTSCVHTNSQLLDEENKKVVSATKRPCHFLTDTTKKPSVGPTTSMTIIRDATQNRSLDINPVKDSGTTISNPITIDSPTSIPRHYPRFIPLGLQQQRDLDKTMQPRSKKPFYSFIPSTDRSNGNQEQRPCDECESADDHGIDLSLKL